MTRRLTVDVDELPALEPSGSWGEPLTVEDVRDDEGPVLVTVEYDVAGGDVDAFVTAMLDVRAIRRRDGARNWHLYRDVALPGRVVESFTVASWGEHLRQHERPTTADLPIEQRARAFVYGYSVRHLVGLRPPAA